MLSYQTIITVDGYDKNGKYIVITSFSLFEILMLFSPGIEVFTNKYYFSAYSPDASRSQTVRKMLLQCTYHSYRIHLQ